MGDNPVCSAALGNLIIQLCVWWVLKANKWTEQQVDWEQSQWNLDCISQKCSFGSSSFFFLHIQRARGSLCKWVWNGWVASDILYIFFLSVRQNNNDKLCLICHEEIRRNGGGAQELLCTHRFHKEVNRLVRGTACLLLHTVFALACPSQRKSLRFALQPHSMSAIRAAVHSGSSCLGCAWSTQGIKHNLCGMHEALKEYLPPSPPSGPFKWLTITVSPFLGCERPPGG